MEGLTDYLNSFTIPGLLLIGLIVIFGFYFGRNMRFIRLPSIIGYMLFGVILGPSFLNLLNSNLQEQLSFITEIALGFVALSIGLELKFSALRKFGVGIIYVIFAESFGAFIVVFLGSYLLTRNLSLALIFASIAPASAPAGTVAVIQEYKAKGSLTKALYTVVGFDDGLGIIIFGFAAAIVRVVLLSETGVVSENFWLMMLYPFKEIILSLLLGGIIATIFSLLARKMRSAEDILILTIGFILASNGICKVFNLSLILTNMVFGMIVVNTQSHSLLQKIHDRLPLVMPLFFILFFTLAGANLYLNALPSLGILGIVYILTRSGGLIAGAKIGAIVGKAEDKIRKYLGLGILSQAGVAIGLALIVKHEFKGLGKIVEVVNGSNITSGDKLGAIVITTVTATCIFFEIIGPVLTKIGLKKAGEINKDLRK
ncbi:MAG: cation:proton antiporter [Candidatus Marinimicrobia bacterium]|nr:cation:proton antiporter [Candidatus Neomarinimicrobiota bacterium]